MFLRYFFPDMKIYNSNAFILCFCLYQSCVWCCDGRMIIFLFFFFWFSSIIFSRNWQCDGENDCDDGSDEMNCTFTTTTPPPSPPVTEKQCSELMFRCDNGHCIPFWWRCDDLDDCGDASDEDGCPGHGSHGNSTTQKPDTTTITHTCQKVSVFIILQKVRDKKIMNSKNT